MDRLGSVPRMLAARNALYGGPLSDAELSDLAQDVVLAIWRRLDRFRGTSTLETWCYGFCENYLMNAVRRKQRRTRVESQEPVDHLSGVSQSPRLEFDFLYSCLESLGESEEEIVRLKHFGGLTFEEIARQRDEPLNTIKSRYYRAFERLRRSLEPHLAQDREGRDKR